MYAKLYTCITYSVHYKSVFFVMHCFLIICTTVHKTFELNSGIVINFTIAK